jgi:hypothetical protein
VGVYDAPYRVTKKVVGVFVRFSCARFGFALNLLVDLALTNTNTQWFCSQSLGGFILNLFVRQLLSGFLNLLSDLALNLLVVLLSISSWWFFLALLVVLLSMLSGLLSISW